MTDMTYEQLELEFMRQIRLCSGLGRWRMVELLLNAEKVGPFDGLEPPEIKARVLKSIERAIYEEPADEGG